MCLLQLRRSSEETVEPEAWVNAFLGRIFWDFLGEKYWADVVSKKIQMKLSKIRVGTRASLFVQIYKLQMKLTNRINLFQCYNVASSRDNFVSLFFSCRMLWMSWLWQSSTWAFPSRRSSVPPNRLWTTKVGRETTPLSVCQQDSTKTTQQISTKLGGKMGHGPFWCGSRQRGWIQDLTFSTISPI